MGRLGGDEFGVILTQTNQEQATAKATALAQEIGVLHHGKAVRHLERGPEPILAAGDGGIGAADDHVPGKRIVLKHPVKRGV